MTTARRPVDPQRASCFVISITPFTEAGGFDEEAVRGHLRRMASAGIGVYLGGGGSGEGYVMSPSETTRLLEIGVEELAGKVPVRSMGVEPRSAQDMVDHLALAHAAGVDAAQVYSLDPGHGHRPTEKEMFTYFHDVLGAVEMPVVLSTHQSVGYQIPVAMLRELAERYPHLVGVNCTHQDLQYLAAVVDALDQRAEIHVGGPMQALTAWSLGAAGYLCSEGNLAPKLCMSVVHAYRHGRVVEMFDAFGRVLRLSGELYGAGGIRATKALLNSLGLPGGSPRKPQLPVATEVVVRLRSLIEDLGIPVIEGWKSAEK